MKLIRKGYEAQLKPRNLRFLGFKISSFRGCLHLDIGGVHLSTLVLQGYLAHKKHPPSYDHHTFLGIGLL